MVFPGFFLVRLSLSYAIWESHSQQHFFSHKQMGLCYVVNSWATYFEMKITGGKNQGDPQVKKQNNFPVKAYLMKNPEKSN